jgi:spoIIIJ-associated protein
MAAQRPEKNAAPPASEPAPLAPAAMMPPAPPAPFVREEPVRAEPAYVEPAAAAFTPAPVPEPAPAPAPEPIEEYVTAPVAREQQPPREERAPRPERAPHEERASSRAPSAPAGEASRGDLSATSRKLTEDLLRAMGFEPKVQVRVDGDRVDVTVEVERDGDLLNGRQGETRQALQHLLNRFLNKGDGSRYHLQLEVNDYWQRREVELAELAKQMAEDAVSRNAEVVTGYMNSQERRMIHVTLKEDARVRTFSLGDGMLKRVAVAPADFPERTEDDSAS